MMSTFVIVTDSSSDLSAELLTQYDVISLPLTVTMEGRDPVPNDEVDTKEFYEFLRSKKGAKTSAVAMEVFKDAFRPYLEEGKDLLYLGFSSGLSNTFNAGRLAVQELCVEFPDRKIFAVDTLCASLGQGLIVYYAAQKRAEGADVETVRDYVEGLKPNLVHLFTVNDLFFLHRGGRVSAMTAIAGSALGIKPIMHVDNEGHLIKLGTKRGRKGSLDELCTMMESNAINPAEQTVFISHGDCLEDAQYLADRVREKMGVKSFVIDYVGPVIGAHSGPGTVALFYLGKER